MAWVQSLPPGKAQTEALQGTLNAIARTDPQYACNSRFSGGIPLTIQAGADFPAMLLRLALGRKVEPAIGAFKDDLWMTSFEQSFFVGRKGA